MAVRWIHADIVFIGELPAGEQWKVGRLEHENKDILYPPCVLFDISIYIVAQRVLRFLPFGIPVSQATIDGANKIRLFRRKHFSFHLPNHFDWLGVI